MNLFVLIYFVYEINIFVQVIELMAWLQVYTCDDAVKCKQKKSHTFSMNFRMNSACFLTILEWYAIPLEFTVLTKIFCFFKVSRYFSISSAGPDRVILLSELWHPMSILDGKSKRFSWFKPIRAENVKIVFWTHISEKTTLTYRCH